MLALSRSPGSWETFISFLGKLITELSRCHSYLDWKLILIKIFFELSKLFHFGIECMEQTSSCSS